MEIKEASKTALNHGAVADDNSSRVSRVKLEDVNPRVSAYVEGVADAEPITLPPPTRLVTSQHDWPEYTDIMLLSGRVNLTSQRHEVKLIARKAIPKLLSFIVYMNAYPNHPQCEAWSQEALLEAAAELRTSAVNVTTRQHYHDIRQRLKADTEYWRHLAKLVGQFPLEKKYHLMFNF